MAKVTKTQVVKFIRKGDKGDPAVNIIVGSDTVVFTKSGQAAKITLQVFIGDRQLNYGDGTNDTFVCSTLGNSHYILDNNVYWTFNVESDNKTFDYLLSLQNKADLSAVLPFTITVNGISYSKTLTIKTVYDGNKGDKGEQGAVLRGPQAWSDCATGYAFQAGGTSEAWKDVVLYNGNYYSCVKSHAKTASNYPGSTTDTNSKLWQLGDSIELVATKILLANYALVKNLGVETIDMRDASGNILFQAKDGNVTCKTGTFENVQISGDLTVAQLKYKANMTYGGAVNCSFIFGGGSYVMPALSRGEYMRITLFNPQLTRVYNPTILTGKNTSDLFLADTGSYFTDTEASVELVGWYEFIGVGMDSNQTLWLYQTIRES